MGLDRSVANRGLWPAPAVRRGDRRAAALPAGADPVVDVPARSATAPTTDGVTGLATVAEALAAAGIGAEDLALRQPTLDEVFLTLTGQPAVDEAETPTEVAS